MFTSATPHRPTHTDVVYSDGKLFSPDGFGHTQRSRRDDSTVARENNFHILIQALSHTRTHTHTQHTLLGSAREQRVYSESELNCSQVYFTHNRQPQYTSCYEMHKACREKRGLQKRRKINAKSCDTLLKLQRKELLRGKRDFFFVDDLVFDFSRIPGMQFGSNVI